MTSPPEPDRPPPLAYGTAVAEGRTRLEHRPDAVTLTVEPAWRGLTACAMLLVAAIAVAILLGLVALVLENGGRMYRGKVNVLLFLGSVSLGLSVWYLFREWRHVRPTTFIASTSGLSVLLPIAGGVRRDEYATSVINDVNVKGNVLRLLTTDGAARMLILGGSRRRLRQHASTIRSAIGLQPTIGAGGAATAIAGKPVADPTPGGT